MAQLPQEEQLEAVQPLQDEVPAEARVVSPPLPLLRKPQADMRRQTSPLSQWLQVGFSFPKTRHSNSLPHFLQ
jgi:hypothetical protein